MRITKKVSSKGKRSSLKRNAPSRTIKRKNGSASKQRKQLEESILNLDNIRKQVKALKELESKLVKDIQDISFKLINPDDKGARNLRVYNEESESFIYLNLQDRTKQILNMSKAIQYFEESELDEYIEEEDKLKEGVTQDEIMDVLAKHAPQLLETERVIKEHTLKELVIEGVLDDKDIDVISDKKESYAAYIKDKEE